MTTTGYGLTGVGVCHRCTRPDFLFVVSDSDYGSSQSPRCADCHSYYRPTPVPRIALMDETPMCEACDRPEFIDCSDSEQDNNRWSFVTAYLADGETQVTVHRECTTDCSRHVSCENCNNIYATLRNRDWRAIAPISNDLFVTFTRIEGNQLCNGCTTVFYDENGGENNYSTCPECDDIFRSNSGGEYNDRLYCYGCYENSVYNCDNCDTLQWDGNGHYCRDDDDESDNTIHSYSYRPSPYFFGKGQYYLGFELEVESRGNSRYEGAEIAQSELGGRAYMKDDGSLRDGFEIVTHPHTLEAYQKEFSWEFIPKLKREGFRSWNTDTCGLHVHVSRTAFGTGDNIWNRSSSEREQIILKRQAHELRFMKLIYDNQRQVERIAGRSNNNYATFSDKGKLINKVKHGDQHNGRYSAINTENDATLEVRVFKGSLRKERVLSALEFVAASVEYTRDLKVTAKNQALTWLAFTGYISTHLEIYPNLALIMSESFASDDNPNEN